MLTKYKEAHKYKTYKSVIFALGIIVIIFSEMSANYAGKNLTNTATFYILPLVIGLIAYLILRNKLIFRKII